MAKSYSRPTATDVEAAMTKAARAVRKADKLMGQHMGTTAIEPSAKQKAAWAASASRLAAGRSKKK